MTDDKQEFAERWSRKKIVCSALIAPAFYGAERCKGSRGNDDDVEGEVKTQREKKKPQKVKGQIINYLKSLKKKERKIKTGITGNEYIYSAKTRFLVDYQDN